MLYWPTSIVVIFKIGDVKLKIIIQIGRWSIGVFRIFHQLKSIEAILLESAQNRRSQ